ncbi:putative transposable element, partial [Trichonephila clavipes]
MWYWARTRDKASHGPIPIPLGYRGHSTLWKILRKNLGLRAYKIQLVQELKPNDHQAWRRFVEWALNEIAVVPDFHKRILFSHEAHFWLNGYVNKQNFRIWSKANPQVYVETPAALR